MKSQELKEKDIKELLVIAEDLKAMIHKIKMDIITNKSNNVNLVKKYKKDLARVRTVIREQELKS
jgi:large subunit ribosomal protein L29